MSEAISSATRISRRTLLKTGGALAVGAHLPGPWVSPAAAQAAPLRLGFQVHRTGIGAVYGRWYERTTTAAVKLINEKGGIGGRPVEIVAEDDGTDPKRGAEVVEKFATQHKVDFIFGTLFSHVVIASAPRAGELKIPYLVVSEGYHVASGGLNRYVFQPGITDVRAQITAVAGWILKNLGKKVTLIFPDYAFGHDHRDFFKVAAAQGGTVRALIPIPPTETSFTKYFPRVPADTEVLYHVMVGPGVLTFAREMGSTSARSGRRSSASSIRWKAWTSRAPGSSSSRARTSGRPSRATPARAPRRTCASTGAVGDQRQRGQHLGPEGHVHGVPHVRLLGDALRDQGGHREERVQAAGGRQQGLHRDPEGFQSFPEGIEHPQGPKRFVGRIHQGFGQQVISRVEGGSCRSCTGRRSRTRCTSPRRTIRSNRCSPAPTPAGTAGAAPAALPRS